MDRILISLKFTLLRNSSRGLRRAGWIIGAALVVGTWVGATAAASEDVRGSVLSLIFAAWVVGTALGPVLLSGTGVLRPDYFALLPISRRTLSRGLLVSNFVGIASAFVLLAFMSAAVHAIQLNPVALVIVVFGAPLTWIFAVTVSRLIYGLLGAAMRSKIGVEIAGIQFGLMFATMFTGWMIVQATVESLPALMANGLPDGAITTVLDAFPSSWPLLAIEQAAAGDWFGAGVLLAALAVLDALLVLATVAVLTPRVESPRRARHGRRLSAGLVDGGGILPKTQLGAVIGKEYRQWTRDPWRALEVRTAVWTGIAIGIFALVSGHYSVLAAFAGLIVAFMMSIAALNLYGQDGTALWLSIVGQDTTSIRSDVRGRQWATILVFLPQTLLITVVFLVLTQQFWVTPILIAALPALFGAGSGAALLISAIGVSPGVDPRKRVGPNDANGDVSVQVWLVMILVIIGVLPTVAIVVLSLVMPSTVLTVTTMGVGIFNGWVAAWLYGRIAITYLSRRLPDVFTRIRYGQVFYSDSAGVLDAVAKSTLQGEQRLLALRQKERQEKIAARDSG